MTTGKKLGTESLTDLQKNLFAALMERRYYNVHSEQPTVYASQTELARVLNARQSEISNGLKQLANRKFIAQAWAPRKGQVALYLILHPSHGTQDDTRTKFREMQTAVPGKQQTERMKLARYPAGQATTRNLEPAQLADEAAANAEAAAMLAEQPDLEGYPVDPIDR